MNAKYTLEEFLESPRNLDHENLYKAVELYVQYIYSEDINNRGLLISAIEELTKAPFDPNYPIELRSELVNYIRNPEGDCGTAATTYHILRAAVEAEVLDPAIKGRLIELLDIIGTNLGAIDLKKSV